MADSGMSILEGTAGVAGGVGKATGRGSGRGGATGGAAGTPGRGATGSDASGDCEGCGLAAGGVGSGGGGATGRGNGSGGAATLGFDARGCGNGAGCVAMGGGAAGRGVPQYPQNLLPTGNDLWHFGHKTWGTVAWTGARKGGVGGSVGTCCGPTFCGFPQRTQAGADAGFIAPQEAQRT